MIPLPTVDVLDSITIPVPCPVPWEEMHGDPRTRFCATCQQNVHDVSELTHAEAVQLLTGGVKLPCLRVYRRQDGRVMTADCMNRRERVRKRLRRFSAPAASLFALVFWLGCSTRTQGAICRPERDTSTVHEKEHIAGSERAAKLTPQADTAGTDAIEEAPAPHEVAPK